MACFRISPSGIKLLSLSTIILLPLPLILVHDTAPLAAIEPLTLALQELEEVSGVNHWAE
jgi:hypothetical protein